MERIEGALIAIDVQLDFCPGGALAVPAGDEVVGVINGCVDRFESLLFTQDFHPPGHCSFASRYPGKKPGDTVSVFYGEQALWPDHCVQGTRGAELHPDLDTSRVELLLRKGFHRDIDSYSAFFENDRKTVTGLGGYLREREIGTLYFGGLATDVCVLYSVLDALRLGFDVQVIEDGCRGIDIDGSLERAWRSMREKGAVVVRSTEFGDRGK